MPRQRITRNPIYPIGPSIAYIPMLHNLFVLVDCHKAAELADRGWHALKIPSNKTTYAYAGTKPQVSMHRLLLNFPDGDAEHKNGNGLDNRLANLRVATRSQNKMNVGLQSNNTSGAKGVSWCKREKKWRVSTCVQGKQRSHGYYDDRLQAIQVRQSIARELHGDFYRE